MSLPEISFSDPRLVLVPIEALSETGVSAAFATLAAPHGFDAPRRALFDAGFARYFARAEDLGRRTRTWPMPRLRHVAIVAEPLGVRPYVQLLNTSAWTLHACDLDPRASHPELVAYLLVLGDRMAVSGEVASAPLHCAAYWLERTPEELDAFTAAAAASARPDAALLRAVAAALPWLRELRHETLRPPIVGAPHRAVPGTGLLVPRALEAHPPAFVEECAAAARSALGAFQVAWRRSDRRVVDDLTGWLAATVPRLLVTAQRGRIVWDADTPARVNALVRELRDADAVAVKAVAEDLRVVDRCSRAFHATLAAPEALPAPDPTTEQAGYAYLHTGRRLVAYGLHAPGMERLRSPALPFARAMLAARTMHEWAHLAVDAGWVRRSVDADGWRERVAALAAAFDAVVAGAPTAVRAATADDVARLTADGSSVGAALAAVVEGRMPDYEANLVAMPLLAPLEREVYVRHNVRTLRLEYPPGRLWPMLARYLYEYQYLGFSGTTGRGTYFTRSTWFDDDFFRTGILGEATFHDLAARVAALCASYAVDETRIHLRSHIAPAEPTG
jgi:hypothetical protein